jgi:hypothetical protein
LRSRSRLANSPQKTPTIEQPFEQRQVERDLGDLSRGETHHEVASLPGHRAHGRLGVLSPDRIQGDVDGAAQVLEGFAQILALVVDHDFGAETLAGLELLFGGRAGDHARTEELPELHGGEADAARRAEHEERLARPDPGAVLERVIGGRVDEAERGGDREIEPGRDRRDERFVDHGLLRVAAPADVRHHPVARHETVHAFADLLDHAGDLAPRREGQLGLELVLVLDEEDIGKIHPARLHGNQKLSLARFGRGNVLDHERVGRPPILAQHGFHARPFRISAQS